MTTPDGAPPQQPTQPPSSTPIQQPTTLPATTAPTISPAQLAEAVRAVEREKSKRQFGRRALLGVAGLGLCCGAAAAAPIAVQKIGLYTQQQLDDALQAGIQQGRQAVLAELRNLEGLAIEDAIIVADLTRRGVTFYVKPLADLVSTLAGDALAGLANVVSFARDHTPDANILGLDVHSSLTALANVLNQWHEAVAGDPLGKYLVTDVTAAEAYLKALQQKINGQDTGTPQPTATEQAPGG
ncbi:MAG TPA: hypothetical protein VFU88_17895 [Ktedonobacterales bacterium]|nr:hypothetical protein [Ktedonobacterales bacterium]